MSYFQRSLRVTASPRSNRGELILPNPRRYVAVALASAVLVGGIAASRDFKLKSARANAPTAASAPQARTTTIGPWQAPSIGKQMPIWPGPAPDMAAASQPPESVLTAATPEAIHGSTSQAVFDVTSPTMTIFPPVGKNTGVAVIVFPGGGFKAVVITLQGTEICSWITSKGMTCIISKYRVPKSNHYRDEKCDCGVTPNVPRALQDAQRTIRLVRSRAKELNIDRNKIGVLGFSAGGYLVVQTSNIFEPAYKAVDAVDKVSSRPDFAISFYPGHLCRSGGKLDPAIHVTKRTPPTFLLQAWDDPIDEICNSTLYARALDQAGVPAEVHLFAKGGHAFGLRRLDHPVSIWPRLVEGWLQETDILGR
jgi:acetyl esterase/lipase